MCLFLTVVILICSVATKYLESVPFYEKPEIIHHNQLTGGKSFGFSKNRLQLVNKFLNNIILVSRKKCR
jgi:hypothetical protein